MDCGHHLLALADLSDDANPAHVHPNIMNLIKCIEVFTLVHDGTCDSKWSVRHSM